MARREPPRTRTRRTRTRRLRVTGALVVVAALAAGFGYHSLAAPDSSTPPATPLASLTAPGADVPRRPPGIAPGAQGEPLGAADGAVPEGTTVFDVGVPGVARLDPALLDALRRAAADAADEGVGIEVNSGWRSPAYQERLLDEATATYGSRDRAARWVATPETSAHVSGDAVDVGPSEAASWLAARGAAYGLCRVYGNEPWHFELRPYAVGGGCPPLYADPTDDPRMQG